MISWNVKCLTARNEHSGMFIDLLLVPLCLSVCLSVNLSEVKEFDGEGREGTVGIGTSG